MSTLKHLRIRIAGVKSTQKITRAMKMVAASKLMKVQDQIDKSRDYILAVNQALQDLLINSQNNDQKSLLTGNGSAENHLLVILSSDRGLCGGFNNNIIKELKKQTQILTSLGKKYKILCIGKIGHEQLKNHFAAEIIETIPAFSSGKFTYEQAKNIATKIETLFRDNLFDVCSFVYSQFFNVIKQVPLTKQVIPFVLDSKENQEVKNNTPNLGFKYEPNKIDVLEYIIPLNLSVQIFAIILDNIASEHGSRMSAMDSATNNASKMIAGLTFVYNRSRQASITKELIEIISSSEVV